MFYDPVESPFYGLCVEHFILASTEYGANGAHIRELGAGTGQSTIDALRRCNFGGLIHGYEIDQESCAAASALIQSHGMGDRYMVHNLDFFAVTPHAEETCAIANPPYLPARTSDIQSPELWGGLDGSDVARQLMNVGFDRVMLMISSYSNPISVIDHALRAGYELVDWLARPIKFGAHSRQAKVYEQIVALATSGMAFVAGNHYLLCGTLWAKTGSGGTDRSAMLRHVLSSFHGASADPRS